MQRNHGQAADGWPAFLRVAFLRVASQCKAGEAPGRSVERKGDEQSAQRGSGTGVRRTQMPGAILPPTSGDKGTSLFSLRYKKWLYITCSYGCFVPIHWDNIREVF